MLKRLVFAAVLFCGPALADGTNGQPGPPASVQIGSQDDSGNLNPASSAHPIPVTTSGGPTAANQTATQAPVAPATATSTHSTAIAGRYHSTPDTVADGQEDEVQLGPHGEQKTCQVDATGACSDPTTPVPVYLQQLVPNGATYVENSATGTTGATTATMPAVLGKTNYVCGFSITANATAAATGTATLTGVLGGTMSWLQWTAPTTLAPAPIWRDFNRCIPASAANVAISAVSAAPGTGGNVTSNIWGFTL